MTSIKKEHVDMGPTTRLMAAFASMRNWSANLLYRIGSEIFYDLKNPPSFCFCHISKRIEMLRLWLIYILEGESGFGEDR